MRGMCNSEEMVNQATSFSMENRKEERYKPSPPYFESQLEIRNKGSTIIDTLFSTLYSETKQPYRGGFGF